MSSPDLAEQIHAGVQALHAQELDQAQEIFESVIAQQPNSAAAHCNLGMIELVRQKPHHAIKHLEKAISFDDRMFHAYLNLGSAYFVTGNIVKSEQI